MRWIILFIIIAGIIFWVMGQRETAHSSAAGQGRQAAIKATPTPTLSEIQERLMAAAREANVQLRGVTLQPRGALVNIAWTSDNAAQGGDFLDTCIRQGIVRDFDANNKHEDITQEDGRRVFLAQYLVFF